MELKRQQVQVRTTVLQTVELSKRYGDKTVVDRLNLTVRQGEIYGFLGPNGAGKTTVMRMAIGLTSPSGGSVQLLGEPSGGRRPEIRRRIGVASESPRLMLDMTGAEYLQFFARLYGVARGRAAAMLERFGLEEAAGRRLGAYSQGMQQRMNLARAFLHEPEMIFLDEPVADLDPLWIKRVRDLVAAEKAAGGTVFISSHLLSMVESLCDRVGIIHRGQLLAEDTVAAVKGRLAQDAVLEVELAEAREEVPRALRELAQVREVSAGGKLLVLRVPPGEDLRERIARTVAAAGGICLGVHYRESSLEDAFLELTEGNVALLGAGR
jgi:ABC-2 type transport system ATP-binding protein